MEKFRLDTEIPLRPEARFAPVRWVARAVFIICLVGLVPFMMSDREMAARMRAAVYKISVSLGINKPLDSSLLLLLPPPGRVIT